MSETQNTQTTFTKVLRSWVVNDPTGTIAAGDTITVTKADGTTKSVYIRSTSAFGAKTPGALIGQFTDAAKREEELAFQAKATAHLEAERIAHAEKVIAMEQGA